MEIHNWHIWLIIFIGICFIFTGGVLLYNHYMLNKRCSAKVSGVVTTPYASQIGKLNLNVSFTINSHNYHEPFHENSDFQEGDVVTVKYDPNTLSEIAFYVKEDQNNQTTLGVFAMVFGGLALLTGVGILDGWIG